MFRSVLSLLILINNVALQAVAVPHAHPGLPGHHGNHIHLGSAQHSHAHPHPHPHQDSTAGDDSSPSDHSSEHDRDAVYIPLVLLAPFTHVCVEANCDSFEPAFALPAPFTVDYTYKTLANSEWLNLDGFSVEECALYLRLRTLRI